MALSTYHAGLAAGECLSSLVDTGWLLGPESGALAPLVRLCVASYLGIIEELSVLLHPKRGLLEPLRGVASCLIVSLLSASRATSRAASWKSSLHGRACSSSAALPLKGLLDPLPENLWSRLRRYSPHMPSRVCRAPPRTGASQGRAPSFEAMPL
jgi:hypothetical protein